MSESRVSAPKALGIGATVLIGLAAAAWMGAGSAKETKVEEPAEQVSTFDAWAPEIEEPKPVVKAPVKAKAPKAPREVVITESEEIPEDFAEWEAEGAPARVNEPEGEKTVDDLPPEMRKVVLQDLPGPGVYRPRLSLEELRKARRPNAKQRKLLQKMAWENPVPQKSLDKLRHPQSKER